jgi:hypothetical protein
VSERSIPFILLMREDALAPFAEWKAKALASGD